MAKGFTRFVKSLVSEKIVLNFSEQELLTWPNRILKLADGTIFYTTKDYLYVKWEGKPIDVELPDGKDHVYTDIDVHENAIYIFNYRKFYKASFSPSTGITVTYLRSLREGEQVNTAYQGGTFCKIWRDGKTYVYRMHEDPTRDGVMLDVSEKMLENFQLRGLQRGKIIYTESDGSGTIWPSATQLSENVILLKINYRAFRFSTFSKDSSKFFYTANYRNIVILNIETLEILPTLHPPIVISSVINEIITAECGKYYVDLDSGRVSHKFVMIAHLPNGYYDGIHLNEETPEIGKISQLQSDDNYTSEFMTKFKTLKFIGQGGYGCVFEAENRLDKWKYAVKRIPLRGREKDMRDALREVRTLASFDHPGIVRYNHSWKETPPEGWQRCSDEKLSKSINYPEQFNYKDECAFLYIQMELCQSTLSEWIKSNKERNLSKTKSWFKQIVRAVAYIHHQNKIHRDLKPSNILFASDNRLKICDLGIVADRAIKNGQEVAETRTEDRGTLMYMAPEQRGWNYTSKVDIFSIGLILAELCVVMTLEETQDAFELYQRGRRTTILNHLPEVEQFVGWLTNHKDTDRPDCKKILEHSFMANVR